MSQLISLENCNPDTCPLVSICPTGPTPNMPCSMKSAFDESLTRRISLMFKDLGESSETRLRLDFLLRPLFEQLLRLRMAEIANPEALLVLESGAKRINPLLAEIRSTITTINKILTETVKAYKDSKNKKLSPDGSLNQVTTKGYYEMLAAEGNDIVEEHTGITH